MIRYMDLLMQNRNLAASSNNNYKFKTPIQRTNKLIIILHYSQLYFSKWSATFSNTFCSEREAETLKITDEYISIYSIDFSISFHLWILFLTTSRLSFGLFTSRF